MVVNPGASPPDPHAFGGTGFFHMPRHHSHFRTPQKTCDAPPRYTHTKQKSLKLTNAFPPPVPFRQGMVRPLRGIGSG